MQEEHLSQTKTQRRRSARVTQSIPLIVRGIDVFGQPFEESTETLVVNMHGCRYASRFHAPMNSWITLEVSRGSEFQDIRARVAWVQQPQSIRESFQVAVELESTANIWGIDLPLESYSVETTPMQDFEGVSEQQQTGHEAQSDASGFSTMDGGRPENAGVPQEQETGGQNPLLRELAAELHRQAKDAAESAIAEASERIRQTAEEEQKRMATADDYFEKWRWELESAQSSARDDFSAQLAATQNEFLAQVASQFADGFRQARELIQEIDQKTQSAREELEAAARAAGQHPQMPNPAEAFDNQPSAIPGWQERLQSELAVAQSQWNELLQSSLDSGMQRLAERLAGQSREALGSAEQKMSERFAELRQPLAETVAEAREMLNLMRSSLEHEMGEARSSLAEIEHVAGRIKDYSSRLDASTHDSLNELHRRIENILESQTEEMNRRAEHLVTGVSQKLTPLIDSLGRDLVERAVLEVESRIAPHLNRVPDLLRDLAAREMQAEEVLRLQRERLRQLSENNQREVGAQIAAAVSNLRNDFESARLDALPKWNEDLSASVARGAAAASESIRQSSEAFQQDAQARLQVMEEQALTGAEGKYREMTSESALRFGETLESQSSARMAGIQQQLDTLAHEISGHARTQMDAAAEAAAASFGQVLRGISDQETQQFSYASRNKVQESAQELEQSAQTVLGNLSANAETTLEQFRARMASQLDASLADSRAAVEAEFKLLLDQFAADKDVRQQEWARGLEQLSDEAIAKHQERLQTSCDSWTVSSVRRLNEHGQNVIESLMRSADQALRDSCSRVFEGMAQMMRERMTNAAGAGGSFPGSGTREMPENPEQPSNQNWTPQ